jgi:hypothetical protein
MVVPSTPEVTPDCVCSCVQEAENKSLSVRLLGNVDLGVMPHEEVSSRLLAAIASKGSF